MSAAFIIDLRSPSPSSSASPSPVRSLPADIPPSPPSRFRSLLNSPRPATRSHIISGGTAGRRLADVIRSRAEQRGTREDTDESGSNRAPRRGTPLRIGGPTRTRGGEDEPIDLAGSSDEDEDIVVTGAANVRPPNVRMRPPPARESTPGAGHRVRSAMTAGNGGFDHAVQGESGV